MNIRLLHRDEIDLPRWNGCVHYAPNSLIYGYAWYLDNVADNWWGLVEDDYQSVFPLPWNDKLFGIKRLYQPPLSQQLGLFTVNGFSEARIKAFLQAIPKEFKHVQLALNDSMSAIQRLPDYKVKERPNYLLPLNQPYEKLYENYSSNHKRNIKKGEKANLFATSSIKPEDFVAQLEQEMLRKGEQFPQATYHAALRIIYNALHRGQGFFMLCLNEQKEVCAAVFWLLNGARYINLLNYTTPAGKEVGAMPYLMDLFIQGQANKPMFIDFEGSSIPGIARFYEGFGAENVPFYQWTENRLPWWIRWKG